MRKLTLTLIAICAAWLSLGGTSNADGVHFGVTIGPGYYGGPPPYYYYGSPYYSYYSPSWYYYHGPRYYYGHRGYYYHGYRGGHYWHH